MPQRMHARAALHRERPWNDKRSAILKYSAFKNKVNTSCIGLTSTTPYIPTPVIKVNMKGTIGDMNFQANTINIKTNIGPYLSKVIRVRPYC